MSVKEEKKQLYEVWIIRIGDDPITAINTDQYDKAYEKWKELTDIWVNAIKDKVPFIMTAPIVTAFDPGSVREITLRPVMQIAASRYENPYHQKMAREGLSNTLRNPGNIINSELLDEGYQG